MPGAHLYVTCYHITWNTTMLQVFRNIVSRNTHGVMLWNCPVMQFIYHHSQLKNSIDTQITKLYSLLYLFLNKVFITMTIPVFSGHQPCCIIYKPKINTMIGYYLRSYLSSATKSDSVTTYVYGAPVAVTPLIDHAKIIMPYSRPISVSKSVLPHTCPWVPEF